MKSVSKTPQPFFRFAVGPTDARWSFKMSEKAKTK